jgi:FkbM family methyltransferase
MKVTFKQFVYGDIEYQFYGASDEHIFKQIPWYEKILLKYISSLNLYGVYVDVGGNIGNHSLYFLNHCNSTFLYTFEPEEFCYTILRKNLRLNAKKKYKIYNQALWDKKVDLKLNRFQSFGNTGLSKVEEITESQETKCIVHADRLDNILLLDDKVVLIKIDAEGSESNILKGAIETIKSNGPVIICEAATQEELDTINSILIPLKYKLFTKKFNATPTYVWNLE